MNIAITGSNGLIGHNLSNYFWIDKKENVYDLDIRNENEGIDLTDEIEVNFYFKNIKKLDALIVCHAYNPPMPKYKSFLDFPLDEFNKYMSINLTSSFLVCREFIRNNSGGNIVLFSSVYGVVSPNVDVYENSEKDIAYGVSKAGIIQLTKHLAIHSAPNFKVNCIVLSGVENNQDKDFQNKYSKKIPIGRMMKVEELNGLVDFLTYTTYCTGSIFTIDGGYTAQ